MVVIIAILIIWMMFNIIWYIPNKLSEHDEKMVLHFRELNLRLNRIEKKLKDKLENESE